MINNKFKLKKWKCFWNEMGEKSDKYNEINRCKKNVQRDTDYIFNILEINHDSVVLDLCCGNGIITNKIAMECKYIYGIDFSNRLIDRANKEAVELNIVNISYLISEARHIPLDNESVDKISCLTSFHYFPNHDYAIGVINEMLRVLKSGGQILITDIPNKDSIGYFFWRLIRNNKKTNQKIKLLNLQPTLCWRKKFFIRVKLLFRKFTNENVESDGWLWYRPSFFSKFNNDDIKKIVIDKAVSKNKLLNYRINIKIIKK